MNGAFLIPTLLLALAGAVYLLGASALPAAARRLGLRHPLDLLQRPFFVAADSDAILRNVAFFRILTGLVVIHRYLDVFGVAASAQEQEAALRLASMTAMFFGGCILLGFLTPVAVVGFAALLLIEPPFFSTLGDQILILILWILLLLGAGRRFGVDSILLKRERFRGSVSALYGLALDPNEKNLAKVRFFALVLFASINFSAVAFHFYDSFWLEGEVLQVAMVAGFWNDHHHVFHRMKEAAPALFDVLCRAGLYIQAFFETFLLLLMYLGRLGRIFVFLQGAGFFLLSLFFINLQYLPVNEVILWGLLFGYRSVMSGGAGGRSNSASSSNLSFSPARPIDRLVFFAFAVCVLFNVLNLSRIHGRGWERTWPWSEPVWRAVYRTFGQQGVNVFNRGDLVTASYRMVVFETDSNGDPFRVVPLMDLNGARLNYLRNDFICYERMFAWLRARGDVKFIDGDVNRFGPPTRRLIETVLALDALLTGLEEGRTYRVEIGRREMVEGSHSLEWGPWTSLVEKEFTLRKEILDRLKGKEPGTFVLPPGHWNSEVRMQRTLEILKDRQPSPSDDSG